jgi:purine-binding chemotaxis protein CheW
MTSVASSPAAPRAPSPGLPLSDDRRTRGGKYLTFVLAGEEYGLEILKVHEILSMLPITRIPRAPDYVRGVINLRGRVIPIIDLRLKFGMPAGIDGTNTCTIVVQVQGVQVGVIVDSVREVLAIADADIEDAPSFGADLNTDYILGIGKSNGRVKLLLDIERVLSAEDLVSLTVPARAE